MMPTIEIIDTWTRLKNHHYLNLTTFRKSGVPVVTPVWFALDAGKLYIWTAQDSGKVKRIRRYPLVWVAPSSHLGKARGPASAAIARILPPEEQGTAQRAMNRKYGWQKRLFELVWRLQGRPHVYLELVQAEVPL
jgi:PPOX class probable F420-dependent enzyme